MRIGNTDREDVGSWGNAREITGPFNRTRGNNSAYVRSVPKHIVSLGGAGQMDATEDRAQIMNMR